MRVFSVSERVHGYLNHSQARLRPEGGIAGNGSNPNLPLAQTIRKFTTMGNRYSVWKIAYAVYNGAEFVG